MARNGERKRGRADHAEDAEALHAKTPKQVKKNAATPQTINLEELKKEWTPGRTDRMGNGIIKISNKPNRPLRGGDWISASDGISATLSLVFYKDGKYYGLTVAHIFNEAPTYEVFTFMKQDEAKVTDSPDGKEEDEFDPKVDSDSFVAYKIGKIVSWSRSTDSVVFEFDDNIEVLPLTVMVASSSTSEIKLPDAKSVVSPPPQGSTLVGFGASRRGFHAGVEIPSTNEAHKLASVPDGSIGITNQENEERIAYPGDCGTIFLDLHCNGVYFHSVGTEAAPWKSFGVPLVQVMRNHSLLGGTNGQINEKEKDHVQVGYAKEAIAPIPGVRFNLHIVPPPLRKTTQGLFKVPKFKIIPYPQLNEKLMMY